MSGERLVAKLRQVYSRCAHDVDSWVQAKARIMMFGCTLQCRAIGRPAQWFSPLLQGRLLATFSAAADAIRGLAVGTKLCFSMSPLWYQALRALAPAGRPFRPTTPFSPFPMCQTLWMSSPRSTWSAQSTSCAACRPACAPPPPFSSSPHTPTKPCADRRFGGTLWPQAGAGGGGAGGREGGRQRRPAAGRGRRQRAASGQLRVGCGRDAQPGAVRGGPAGHLVRTLL
jgi:hypothetical protein